jgi:BNR repeat-like domain
MNIIEHSILYRNENEFCSWPFSGGMWQFDGGEVVVGFTRAPVDYANPKDLSHSRIEREVGTHCLARSFDGGLTWDSDNVDELHSRPAYDQVVIDAPRADGQGGPYDPTQDGYMLMCGFGNPPADKPSHAYTSVSTDRGKTWSAPLRLPTWHPGVSDRRTWSFVTGRPSYVVREDGMLLLFGAASRNLSQEAWGMDAVPVVFASPDGGAYWGFLGEMEMENPYPLSCTPYPMLRRDGAILCAVRRQYSSADAFTQAYISEDGGLRWRCLSRVNDWGAPANLVELSDGRIACVYGVRHRPFGIRARVSEDGGATWGTEFILRDDGGSWDLGYPRTLLLEDDTLLTAYYFNSKDDPIQQNGGVRHIAATRWKV